MALTETIGIGKGSVHITDFVAADLIVVVGQNPGTNHPRMLTTLEEAKRAGATIVAINPLPEAGLLRFKNPQRPGGLFGSGTQLADEHLPIRINGDLAFFKAVNHLLVTAGDTAGDTALDTAFIEQYTSGFEDFADDARSFDWEHFERATGFTRDVAERFTEHVRASAAHHRLLGDGPHAARQLGGDDPRDRQLPAGAGQHRPPGRRRVPRAGTFERPGRSHDGDLRASRCLRSSTRWPPNSGSSHRGRPASTRSTRSGRCATGGVQVFVGMGGNFASATPDTAVTHAALERCRLTVQVSTKLNMSHVVTGDQALILPTMGRTERHEVGGVEQVVTVEDSMGVVHASRGTLRKAAPQLLSEVEIVCGLAEALFDDATGSTVDWGGLARDHAAIRDSISRVVPGFDDFNAKIAEPGGFVLPHGPRDDRTFATPDGRARFTINELSHAATAPGTLLLQTIRSHDQYNTTIYGLDDRYRGVHNGRRVVFVSPDDLEALAIRDGDVVDLRSVDVDGVERVAPRFRVIDYPDPGRQLRGLLPRDERPRPPRQHERRRHPHLQVDPHHADLSRGVRHFVTGWVEVGPGQSQPVALCLTPRNRSYVTPTAWRRRARPRGRRRGGCGT